jgi:hypothetical protein
MTPISDNPTDYWDRPVTAYMVKQFVARMQRSDGQRFNVFTTGDDRYYLFDPIDAHGCSYGGAWPILRKRLPTPWRRALARGQGNVDEAYVPTAGRSPIVQVPAHIWAEALAALQREHTRETPPHG